MEFQCLFAKEVVVGSSPIGVMPDFPEDISIVGIYVNILLIYVGYKVVSNETMKWKTLIWKVFYLRNYFHLNIKKILNFSFLENFPYVLTGWPRKNFVGANLHQLYKSEREMWKI